MNTPEGPEKVPNSAEIARLNDILRTRGIGGKIMMSRLTAQIQEEYPDVAGRIFAAVQNFDQFEAGNDPYAEHDFGSVEVDGYKVFWKIDYYDPTYSTGSEDPSDPSQT